MMLMGALRVILGFMNYALTFRIEGYSSGQLIIIAKGLLMSLLVVIINCLMRLVVLFSTFRSNCSPMLKNTTAIPNTKAPLFFIIRSFISLTLVVLFT